MYYVCKFECCNSRITRISSVAVADVLSASLPHIRLGFDSLVLFLELLLLDLAAAVFRKERKTAGPEVKRWRELPNYTTSPNINFTKKGVLF